jgi:RAP1 GTPase activating protein 1
MSDTTQQNTTLTAEEESQLAPSLRGYSFSSGANQRDSFDALGLGRRDKNKIQVRVTLPNNTAKVLDIPLKHTVDRVKAAVFADEPSLVGESHTEYQLAVNEKERLEVEFVKLSESHDLIRRAVNLERMVEVLLLPKETTAKTPRKNLERSFSTQNVNKGKLTRIDSTHSSTGHVSKHISTQINNIAPLLEAAKPPTGVSPGHKRNNSQMSDSEASDMKSSSEEVSSKSQGKKKSHDDTVSSASSSPELGRKKWTPPVDGATGPQAFRLTEDDIKNSKKSLIGKQRDTVIVTKDEGRQRRSSSMIEQQNSDEERDKHKKKKDKEKDKKEKKAKEVKDKDKDKSERSKSPIAIRKMLRSSSSSSIERKGVKKTTSTTTVTTPTVTEETDKKTAPVSESPESSPSVKRRVPQIVMTPSTPPGLNLSSGSIAMTANSINSITSALSLDNTPISSPHSFDVKKFHGSSDSLGSSSELRKSGSGMSETGEIELEVEDLKSANFITLSMSRKGTMRNNFANSRARSNSVVASRPGGEVLAKRKPTAANGGVKPEDFTASFEPTMTVRTRRGSFSLLEDARSSIKDGASDEKSLPPLMKSCKGFWVEVANKLLPYDQLNQSMLEVENLSNDVLWYKDFFVNHEHQNYIGMDENLGPYVVSVVREVNASNQNSKLIRVLLRTKKDDERKCIREKLIKNKSKLFKWGGPSIQDILKAVRPSLNKQKIRMIKAPELVEDLQLLEERLMVKSYKFGVLFCKEGQTREEEMFSNVHGNEAFESFLTFVGQKVVLKGWEGYRGGLDARNDSTGTHSIYTTYSDFEIMFHVSTYLPYTPENPQQLERKRHLGNDIVVLVFKEGNTPYVPNTITSEFNHVFIVVQPMIVNGKQKYRLSCGSKDGVPAFGPDIPDPAIFDKNELFRSFVLAKLINAERAAYRAPAFSKKIARTRLSLLQELEERYS